MEYQSIGGMRDRFVELTGRGPSPLTGLTAAETAELLKLCDGLWNCPDRLPGPVAERVGRAVGHPCGRTRRRRGRCERSAPRRKAQVRRASPGP